MTSKLQKLLTQENWHHSIYLALPKSCILTFPQLKNPRIVMVIDLYCYVYIICLRDCIIFILENVITLIKHRGIYFSNSWRGAVFIQGRRLIHGAKIIHR